jgi:hypothetical protein
MVNSKKKWTVMNPIQRQIKKRNPSSGQNGQLVHWWLLIHSGPPSKGQNEPAATNAPVGSYVHWMGCIFFIRC